MVEDYEVAEAMMRYGGSFVQILGELTARADLINLEKIKSTWPEYWGKYTEFAEGDKQKNSSN